MASPTDPSFDPTGAVRFDLRSRLGLGLARGTARARSERGAREPRLRGARRNRPRRSAARVAHASPRGSAVTTACARPSLEVAVAHLSGELAIAGIGAVHVERWGRAMVAIVSNPSIADDAFVGAVLAGALSAASGREVAAAALGREGDEARYFLGSAATSDASGRAGRVRQGIRRGRRDPPGGLVVSANEKIARLQGLLERVQSARPQPREARGNGGSARQRRQPRRRRRAWCDPAFAAPVAQAYVAPVRPRLPSPRSTLPAFAEPEVEMMPAATAQPRPRRPLPRSTTTSRATWTSRSRRRSSRSTSTSTSRWPSRAARSRSPSRRCRRASSRRSSSPWLRRSARASRPPSSKRSSSEPPPANEIEEPSPSSSRRPIAGEEPVAEAYSEESAPRHTPPPESGKQVAAAPSNPPARSPACRRACRRLRSKVTRSSVAGASPASARGSDRAQGRPCAFPARDTQPPPAVGRARAAVGHAPVARRHASEPPARRERRVVPGRRAGREAEDARRAPRSDARPLAPLAPSAGLRRQSHSTGALFSHVRCLRAKMRVDCTMASRSDSRGSVPVTCACTSL